MILQESLSVFADTGFPPIRLFFADTPATDTASADLRVLPSKFLPNLLDGSLIDPRITTIVYGEIEHMAAAFSCGCADYLVEPWLPEELFLRARRAGDRSFIDFPGGRIDITPFALVSGALTVALSRQEYLLLRLLARHINSPVPRNVLYREFGRDADGSASRAVDVHMSALRRKLRLCGLGRGSRNPLRSVRGFGYALSNGL